MITFRPDHKVTLRRYDKKAKAYLAGEDISNDVVSISTSKSYARSAGGFQITTTFKPFIADKRYDEVVKPNDVILISLDAGDGQGMKSVMAGLVDRVGRVRAYDAEGRPQFRCRINGMDFGKLLMQHHSAFEVERFRDTVTGKMIGHEGDEKFSWIAKQVAYSGTPRVMIQSVFDVVVAQQLVLAPEYIRLWFPDSAEDADDWQTFDMPTLQSEGAVWNSLKARANEPYSTLLTETYNDKLYVIHEKYPIDDTTGKLTHSTAPLSPMEENKPGVRTQAATRGVIREIKDQLIVSEDLGVCDNDRQTYIYLEAPTLISYGGVVGNTIALAQGIFNAEVDEIRRHGFQPWNIQQSFAPPVVQKFGLKDTQSETETVKKRVETIWNRVKNNHTLESGTLVIHGAPKYKVGDAALTEAGMEYLVEQVSHNYQIGNAGTSYTTSLGLTRGQKHSLEEYDP